MAQRRIVHLRPSLNIEKLDEIYLRDVFTTLYLYSSKLAQIHRVWTRTNHSWHGKDPGRKYEMSFNPIRTCVRAVLQPIESKKRAHPAIGTFATTTGCSWLVARRRCDRFCLPEL
jgi:hypothetical protein